MLEIEDVSAGYGATTILRKVSLTVGKGKVVALVGSNGAGKTTLLRALSGIIRPIEGVIRFKGQDIQHARPQDIVRLGIAHCPEERKVWPQMTVEENLELGAFVLSSKSEIKETLHQIYDEFPVLRERRKECAGKLSGGQQQMVAVGRALMSKPKMVLFDEPSLGLSPMLMKQIATIIQKIQKQGIAVLLVEQNVRMALRLADFAYVLGSGRIVASSPAATLRNDPALLKAYLGN
jgi:branched-chain amino acid transport system ATP-binding protein